MDLTDAFITFTLASIAIFDVYIIIKKGSEASISRKLYTGSKKYPVIAFMIGFAMGHIFWANC